MDLLPMGFWTTDKEKTPTYPVSLPKDIKDEDIYWQEYKSNI